MSHDIVKKTREEFAANYAVITSDGFFGPVSVGNINEYNGRIIMNLCVKTVKSQEKNAAISFPQDWYSHKPFPFATGDQVNILIEEGFVRKAYRAKAKPVSTVSAVAVNKAVGEAVANIQAEQAVKEAMKEIAQSVPAEARTDQPF